MNEHKISTATRLVRRKLQGGTPTFIWGKPGVGKSDMMRQIADLDYDGNLIDFRAVLRNPVDLLGLPSVSGDTAKWLVPDDLPQVERDGERGILFLDELNAAPPMMMAACFGLVLDRKIGGYTLPDGWVVAAAGNRQSDRAAANKMPTALRNRFAHFAVTEDLDDFCTWGYANGINPMVIAFLRFRPLLLHKMEHDKEAFPTPRSWAQASKYADDPDDIRPDLVAADVGQGAADEFEGFIRVVKDLPSLDLIFANPDSAPIVTEQSARFAVGLGLARRATAQNIDAGLRYIRRLGAREFEISYMIEATRRDAGLSHTRTFTDWSVDNQDVIMAS